jgi:hypothetical protein
MSELSPPAIAGHPRSCGDVGRSKKALNHSAVTGWNKLSGSAGELAVLDRFFLDSFFSGESFCILFTQKRSTAKKQPRMMSEIRADL